MKSFIFCLTAGFALVLSGCSDNDNVNKTNADKSPPGNVEPEDVQKGNVPMGEEITLKGEVTKVFDTHTFRMDDPGFDFDKDLVVVTKDALPMNAVEGATVQATGTVKKFSVVDVDKDYDWDFDPEVKVELEDVKYFLGNAKVEVLQPAEK